MSSVIELLATDFDGTLYVDTGEPPIPERLEALIGALQTGGARWAINTGRDLACLMEGLSHAALRVWPDFLVVVEQEIFRREGDAYVAVEAWNDACRRARDRLFLDRGSELRELVGGLRDELGASLYEDALSPFCFDAESAEQLDRIEIACAPLLQREPRLALVRNHVYARFTHADYNKGTALAAIGARLGVSAERTCAAGDDLNDLPMLRRERARWLLAPSNAVPRVAEAVRRQGGFVSSRSGGEGLVEGLERHLIPVVPWSEL